MRIIAHLFYNNMNNWREDPSLTCTTFYEKKFAIFPVTCHDGTKVWLKNYYTKHAHYGFESPNSDNYLFGELIERITEAEYIVRKLSENL